MKLRNYLTIISSIAFVAGLFSAVFLILLFSVSFLAVNFLLVKAIDMWQRDYKLLFIF